MPAEGVDVWMVAPKAPGPPNARVVRRRQGRPVAGRRRAGRDRQRLATGLRLRQCCRIAKAGLIKTTFKEETETDLFGEQSVLCGGITSLIKAGWETLVEAGYQPEVAYYECLNEMKLIVDLMFEGGMARMRYSVSDTAEFGDYVSGPRIIDASVKARMRDVLEGDPGRHVCAPLARRERDGPAELHEIPRGGRQRADGKGWSGPACADEQAGADHHDGISTMADYVTILDTTLRDGEEAPGFGLTMPQKVEMAQQLARLGVDAIEAGFPAASPENFEAVQRIAREVRGPIITGLARAAAADIDQCWEAIKDAQHPRIHTFLPSADMHARRPAARAGQGPRRGRWSRAPEATPPTSSFRPWTPRAPTGRTSPRSSSAVIDVGRDHGQHRRHARLRPAR